MADGTQVSAAAQRPSLRAGATMPDDLTESAADRDASEGASPQVRAGALVATTVLFLLAVVLTPLGKVPWWSPLVMLVALGGVVAWLRSGAVKAAAQAPAAPRRSSVSPPAARADRMATPESARVIRPERTSRPEQPQRDVRPAASAELAADQADAPVESVVVDKRDEVFDARAGEVVEEAPAARAANLDPNGWEPVAVPPPTYTLKEKAPERVEQEPAATTPEVAAPVSYADMPVEDLPFDGLALDEELEELPAVHRAG